MFRNFTSCSYIICFFAFVCFDCSSQNVGPLVKMTRGEVWPKPMQQEKFAKFLKLEPESFHFNVRKYQLSKNVKCTGVSRTVKIVIGYVLSNHIFKLTFSVFFFL